MLDYLESEAPDDGPLCSLSIADMPPAFPQCRCAPDRWAGVGPMTQLATPPFQTLARIEDAILRTPIDEQRAALKALGAPVSAETYASTTARRGIMPI